jgi:hypothetical protein
VSNVSIQFLVQGRDVTAVTPESAQTMDIQSDGPESSPEMSKPPLPPRLSSKVLAYIKRHEKSKPKRTRSQRDTSMDPSPVSSRLRNRSLSRRDSRDNSCSLPSTSSDCLSQDRTVASLERLLVKKKGEYGLTVQHDVE